MYSLDDTPSMDELERFLCSIVSRVRPRSNEVPEFSWLRGGLRRLFVITTFHFADFRVSKHDSIRMKTIFQQLLDEGRNGLMYVRVPRGENLTRWQEVPWWEPSAVTEALMVRLQGGDEELGTCCTRAICWFMNRSCNHHEDISNNGHTELQNALACAWCSAFCYI